jgi:ubiquinone/menaquinone biosynthesis C-methylase UbiE
LLFVDHSPVVKGKLAENYAKNYYTIEDDIFAVFEKLDTPFLDKRLKPGMRVFDATMGRGRHAIRYAKRGCDMWANDLNPHMVGIGRRAAKAANAKIKFSVLDARFLKGVPSGRFDVSYSMFSSIGTIPKKKNRQLAIGSIARVTKPGGLVIIHAHNFLDSFFKPDFIGWAVKSIIRPDKTLESGDMVTDYNGLEDMFNHFYFPWEFRNSMREAGLEVIEEHYMVYSQKRFITGPLRGFKADGFIFVGRRT